MSDDAGRSSAIASCRSTASSTRRKAKASLPARLFVSARSRSTSNGRDTEHRLTAPYPARPPWEHGPSDPYLRSCLPLSAEAGSFMHVGWPFPLPTIDLYAEYMVLHNTEMVRKARGETASRRDRA